jgi:hypothetical protein
MDPVDIWRAARLMVQKHGEQAPERCKQRATALTDTDGEAIWEAIARAAQELIDNGPPGDVSTH